jgi:hypothetical protein
VVLAGPADHNVEGLTRPGQPDIELVVLEFEREIRLAGKFKIKSAGAAVSGLALASAAADH